MTKKRKRKRRVDSEGPTAKAPKLETEDQSITGTRVGAGAMARIGTRPHDPSDFWSGLASQPAPIVATGRAAGGRAHGGEDGDGWA